jgi:RNA polymerase sigma-70 factor, ECF subfamily
VLTPANYLHAPAVCSYVSDEPTPVADAHLVARANLGDLAAFEAFLRRHDSGIRALTARVLGAAWDEDVVQDAYLKAFRALPSIRPGSDHLAGWLFRIAYRCAIDELRRRGRGMTMSLGSLERHGSRARSDVADLMSPAGDDEVLRRLEIEAAVARLRPEERATVVLIDQLGFDYESAARVIGVPRGTVASRVNSARRKLRMSLSDAPPTEHDSTGVERSQGGQE